MVESAELFREAEVPLPSNLIILLSISCGMTAANLYYCQPLLQEMSNALHLSSRQIGIVPALTQFGYAAGLLLFIPLGDRLPRKQLVLSLLLLEIISLLAACFSSSLALLAAASLTIGTFTVVPQILVPYAAQASPPKLRGATIGKIQSGLLVGILVSRSLSGYVGEHYSWRAMFGLAAAGTLLLAITLNYRLPESRGHSDLSYFKLLKSVWTFLKSHAELQVSCLTGASLFACFSVFWATLSFLLNTPAYHLGPEATGLFGLVGLAGALAAPFAGKLAHSRGPRFMVGVMLIMVLLAYAIYYFAGYSIMGLVAGVILMDLGVQAGHISNQTRIFAIAPSASSRINTAYMVSYFLGGSIGALLGTYAWSVGRWHAVCLTGLGFVLIGLASHLMVGNKRE